MDLDNGADTLQEAIIWFAEFENCKRFMMELRWPDGVVKCPQCGSEGVTWLSKARVWKCYAKHPRPTFSLKTGTIFEDSPLPLSKWLPAAWLIINCKNGVSSYEISRDLAITQKSTWFMLHRIRLAMKEGSFDKKFSGEVEADETFVGGKLGNMHAHRQAKLRALGRSRGGVFGKAIVTGLLDRNTKKARVKVTGNVRQFGIRTNVIENVEKGSSVYSDALKSYRNLGADGFVHEFIDHTETYVKGRVHTNGLENFWSLFKRALKGTYVSVEPFHLQAYADEQSFRYNNRQITDPERFAIVMKQIVGRRITYKELTGKTESQAETRP
jgi:transposase-like protein